MLFRSSTAVAEVQVDFGTPHARKLGAVSPDELRELLAQGQFPPGSMGPKIQAALAFLDKGGSQVVITDPGHLMDAVQGRAGTRIRCDGAAG